LLKSHAIKTYWEDKVKIHTFKYLGIRCYIWRWVGPKPGIDVVAKRKKIIAWREPNHCFITQSQSVQ